MITVQLNISKHLCKTTKNRVQIIDCHIIVINEEAFLIEITRHIFCFIFKPTNYD